MEAGQGTNGSVGSRLAAAMLAAAVLFALAAGGPARVATAEAAGAVQYFRQGGCPVRYRAETISKYSAAKKSAYRRALRTWRFDEVGGMRIKPPFDWRRGRSAAIRSKVHQMRYLDRLIGIADRRKLTTTRPFGRGAEKKAFRHALALAVDWAQAARAGRVPGADAWKQRVAGVRAPSLAYLARSAACKGKLSEEQARPLRSVMRRHARVLRKRPPKGTPRNHGLSINAGLSALGTYFPKDPVIRKASHEAHKRFAGSLRHGYDPREFVWLEHSPRYHMLAYRSARSFQRRFAPSAKKIQRVADRLRRTLGRFLMPDDRFVTFGDTSGERIEDRRILSARRPGWWVARRSGYAIHAAADRWFGVTAGYHARQHKQADELSFDLYERGRRLIQDTGFFTFEKNSWGRYQASSRAHSVLTVDGRDFDWKLRQRPYGSGIVAAGSGDGWYAVRARNPLLIAPRKLTKAQRRHSPRFRRRLRAKLRRAARFNAEHTRTFVYKPGQALFVVDAVRSDRRHLYRRYFQFGTGVNVGAGGGTDVGFEAGAVGGKLLTASSVPVGSVKLSRGATNPVLGFAFPATGERLPRTAAVIATSAKELGQVSGLFYGGPDVGAIGFAGTLDGVQELIMRRPNGRTLSTLTITRDRGRLAVREQQAGGGGLFDPGDLGP